MTDDWGHETKREDGTRLVWRTGRKLGRTLYRGDVLVGMVDTPALAEAIVEAMNGRPVGPDGTLREMRRRGDRLAWAMEKARHLLPTADETFIQSLIAEWDAAAREKP